MTVGFVLVGMWGFHDRLLTLRKALFQTMTSSDAKDAFFRRWRWHQTQINKQVLMLGPCWYPEFIFSC